MRHDAIEIGMAQRAARRRHAKRMMRSILGAQGATAGSNVPAPATDAVDEAFAGMSNDEARSTNVDLLSQLSEQLEALEHQRDKLVKLLRDIET
jgi:hypothetical protein